MLGEEATIVVIGAGVAGLQTLRSLRAHGFAKVRCFEAASDVGGVWREHYAGYGVQGPRATFEFMDFPFHDVKMHDYPTGEQVKSYIKDFATHFDLLKYVDLNASVKKAETHDNKWTLRVVKSGSVKEVVECDYLIVATGMYSVPQFPEAVRALRERRNVLHASQFVDAGIARGKKVVVMGSAKSAIDCCVAAADVQSPVTWLFRRAHWAIPQFIGGFLQMHYVFYSRFGQGLVNYSTGPMPGTESSVRGRCVVRPVVRAAFRAVEYLFAVQRNQFGAMRPETSLLPDAHGYGYTTNATFTRRVKEGRVVPVKATVDEIKIVAKREDGATLTIKLGSGEAIEGVDLLICGTGYAKTWAYFGSDVLDLLDVQDDGLHLYKNVFPCDSVRRNEFDEAGDAKLDWRQLAFVGSETSTGLNVITSGLQAELLARVLAGKVQLPPADDMVREVRATAEWKRSWMLPTTSRAAFIFGHQNVYHDALLALMREQPLRKRWSLLECFEPYGAGDYDGIVPDFA